MSGAPILTVDDVSLQFGGVRALTDVSFTVEERSITSLIGPNGAGKTSMFNCVTRLYKPKSGSIRINDTELLGMSRYRMASLGIARTFQTPALFSGMTVLENLLTGRYVHGRTGLIDGFLGTPAVTRRELVDRAAAEEVLELFGLTDVRDDSATELSYGTKKRIEFARAVVQDPKLLLLDEPMAGMTADEKIEMSANIELVRSERGVSVLLVEHDMNVVMGISDHVVVLNFGRKIGEGTPSQVRQNPDVVAAYLGEEVQK